jgi:hypothetical protein
VAQGLCGGVPVRQGDIAQFTGLMMVQVRRSGRR